MKYANASIASTREIYNSQLIVNSVHKSFDLAIKASGTHAGIITVSNEIKKGDSINENGDIWTAST